MKTLVVLAVLVSVSVAFQFTEEWELWKKKYSKTYGSDEVELNRHITWESNRLRVENHNANANKYGYTLEMNEFADMVSLIVHHAGYMSYCIAQELIVCICLHCRLSKSTSLLHLLVNTTCVNSQESSEFARVYNGLLPIPEKRNTSNERHAPVGVSLPDTVDWRQKGVVTPVKNQVSSSIAYLLTVAEVCHHHFLVVINDIHRVSVVPAGHSLPLAHLRDSMPSRLAVLSLSQNSS